jgi:hypothetical protein
VHERYAERVFALGKDAYIDKTFAPDLESADRIFALAKEYRRSFFTSSALRYSDEIALFSGNAVKMTTKGGGSSLEEYIIHQIEMVVKCVGVGAEKLSLTENDECIKVSLSYPDGRSAEMNYAPSYGFWASVTDEKGSAFNGDITSPFFDNLIADIMAFFETGKSSFSGEETLEVIKIRENVIKSLALTRGETIKM